MLEKKPVRRLWNRLGLSLQPRICVIIVRPRGDERRLDIPHHFAAFQLVRRIKAMLP